MTAFLAVWLHWKYTQVVPVSEAKRWGFVGLLIAAVGADILGFSDLLAIFIKAFIARVLNYVAG